VVKRKKIERPAMAKATTVPKTSACVPITLLPEREKITSLEREKNIPLWREEIIPPEGIETTELVHLPPSPFSS
jgi:hypothetical protein